MTLVLRGSSPTVCAGPLLHPRPQLPERSRCGEPSGTEEATWAACKPPGTVTLLRCLQNQNPDLEQLSPQWNTEDLSAVDNRLSPKGSCIPAVTRQDPISASAWSSAPDLSKGLFSF